MGDAEHEQQQSTAVAETAAPKIFISYRRDDSSGDARLVYDRLARRFGGHNVFLDVVTMQPGVDWVKTMWEQGAACAVFIALIGSRWMSNISDRAAAAFAGGAEDIVRRELEFALRRGSGVHVVPVLIDDATMPDGRALPRSIRGVAAIQALQLRHTVFDEDVNRLLATIERLPQQSTASPPRQATEPPAPPQATEPPAPRSAPARPSAPSAETEDGSASNLPDARHYDRILRHLADEGTLVILLGSHVNASDRDEHWSEGSKGLPDGDELAIDLARRFELGPQHEDLAAIAQQVCVTSGRPDLYRTLRQLLPREAEPSGVHRFLARLPAELELLGARNCYQLIVTTNYDAALETAFDAENEPYDLAVYMASGSDRGKFVHIPYDRDPETILVPNQYGRFPIDEYGELTRTVILKIHGGVDGSSGSYRWRENYVITEDQYIDYLSSGPIESLIPVQILDKLTGSHWLFLGYTMRDWNLRVFINRVCRGEPLGARSWAIDKAPEELEKDFWSQAGVELFSCSLIYYLNELSQQLGARRTSAG